MYLVAKVSVWLLFSLGTAAVAIAAILYGGELFLPVKARTWEITDKRLQRLYMFGFLFYAACVALHYISS